MNYDLPRTEKIAKDVFDLYTYDVEWSGGEGSMSRLMDFLWHQVQDRAITVCSEAVKGDKGDKAFDRGYVKGLHEMHKFLVASIKLAKTNKLLGK